MKEEIYAAATFLCKLLQHSSAVFTNSLTTSSNSSRDSTSPNTLSTSNPNPQTNSSPNAHAPNSSNQNPGQNSQSQPNTASSSPSPTPAPSSSASGPGMPPAQSQTPTPSSSATNGAPAPGCTSNSSNPSNNCNGLPTTGSPLNPELERLREAICALLTERFEGHWPAENEPPLRGQAFRCISVSADTPLDALIVEAAARANIDLQTVQFPSDFNLWIDPGDVLCRFGDMRTHPVQIASRSNDGSGHLVQHTLNISEIISEAEKVRDSDYQHMNLRFCHMRINGMKYGSSNGPNARATNGYSGMSGAYAPNGYSSFLSSLTNSNPNSMYAGSILGSNGVGSYSSSSLQSQMGLFNMQSAYSSSQSMAMAVAAAQQASQSQYASLQQVSQSQVHPGAPGIGSQFLYGMYSGDNDAASQLPYLLAPVATTPPLTLTSSIATAPYTPYHYQSPALGAQSQIQGPGSGQVNGVPGTGRSWRTSQSHTHMTNGTGGSPTPPTQISRRQTPLANGSNSANKTSYLNGMRLAGRESPAPSQSPLKYSAPAMQPQGFLSNFALDPSAT